MMLSDRTDTVLTEEEFLSKIFRKSKSQDSVDLVEVVLHIMRNSGNDCNEYRKSKTA